MGTHMRMRNVTRKTTYNSCPTVLTCQNCRQREVISIIEVLYLFLIWNKHLSTEAQNIRIQSIITISSLKILIFIHLRNRYIVTPFRNGLTLAAQDAASSSMQIYGKVWSRGTVRAWEGGIYPAVAACPQFLTLGPLYHLVQSNFNNTALSTVVASAAETAITFGPEAKNAHLAWNVQSPGAIKTVQNPLKPWGQWGVL